MQIGIVGKPNVGKSTFFGAATMAPVEIANYPFTTIEPNKGVAYVRTPCPCRELGVKCTPHNSICVDGTRMVPVELLDVAGLVPDAWQGKGLGNKFLDDLRQADALINVVDASGSTDIEGNPVDTGTHDPTEDILFLRTEIECWMREIIKNGFAKIARQAKMQGSKPEAILAERLQGLKVTEAQIKEALREVPLPDDPTKWDDDLLLRLCGAIRERSKPMIAAMNKADLASKENLAKIEKINPICVPTMAETELALKKAAAGGLVDYTPGDASFKIKDGAKVSDGQRKGGSSRTAQVVRRPSSVSIRAAGAPAGVQRSSAESTRSRPGGTSRTKPSLGEGERAAQSFASSGSMGQAGGSKRA